MNPHDFLTLILNQHWLFKTKPFLFPFLAQGGLPTVLLILAFLSKQHHLQDQWHLSSRQLRFSALVYQIWNATFLDRIKLNCTMFKYRGKKIECGKYLFDWVFYSYENRFCIIIAFTHTHVSVSRFIICIP